MYYRIDFGIYATSAVGCPTGPWTRAPCWCCAGRGLIDPCPLWDDDGSVRNPCTRGRRAGSGINNVLTLRRLRMSSLAAADDGGA
ncbi:MAG: hypothetical protein U0599_27900 [Vicinamibacteria bacterium]